MESGLNLGSTRSGDLCSLGVLRGQNSRVSARANTRDFASLVLGGAGTVVKSLPDTLYPPRGIEEHLFVLAGTPWGCRRTPFWILSIYLRCPRAALSTQSTHFDVLQAVEKRRGEGL